MGIGSRALARRVAEQPQQQAFFTALKMCPRAASSRRRAGCWSAIRAARSLAPSASRAVSDKDEACDLAGAAAAQLTGDTG